MFDSVLSDEECSKTSCSYKQQTSKNVTYIEQRR